MKVVKLPHEVAKFKQDENLKRCVTTVDETQISEITKEDAQKAMSSLFGGLAVLPIPNSLWMEHKFEKEMSDHEKDRYEWFVAGFLYYYDTELRNDAVDHHIYFKWETHKVSIYMNPPPLQALHVKYPASSGAVVTTDPPRPPQAPPPPRNP